MDREENPQEIVRRVLHICRVLASVATQEDGVHHPHTSPLSACLGGVMPPVTLVATTSPDSILVDVDDAS